MPVAEPVNFTGFLLKCVIMRFVKFGNVYIKTVFYTLDK